MAGKRIYEFAGGERIFYVCGGTAGEAMRKLVERIGKEADVVSEIREYPPGVPCRFHDMSTDQTVDVWQMMEDDGDAVLRVWKDVQVN